jgi:FkbM family methyltransferase
MTASLGQARGSVHVPSAFPDGQGRPRFHMEIPREGMNDAGLGYLVHHELRLGGYEHMTRAFLDAHLEPGDVFVDVGAHWGVFSLHAATRWPAEIDVVAVEPHPVNLVHLLGQLRTNGLVDRVEVVAGAASNEAGSAWLAFDTTMGHSIDGVGRINARDLGGMHVATLRLDALLERLAVRRPELSGRRLVMKIDVEGFEAEVIEGAEALVESGRVAAIVWEQGRAFLDPERRARIDAVLGRLSERGFSHHRLPHPEMPGALVPYVPMPEAMNVFSVAGSIATRDHYEKPSGPIVRLARPFQPPEEPDASAASTRRLVEARSPDASRWAHWEKLSEGASERALVVASALEGVASVLDVGAGRQALREVLPASVRYRAVDLVGWTVDTFVADLDRGDRPPGEWEAVVLSCVLEHLHDPLGVLTWAGVIARKVVVLYRETTGGDRTERLAAGCFNHFEQHQLAQLAAESGLSGIRVESRGEDLMLVAVGRGGVTHPA